jgi:signal transduction histidine kinase
MAKRLTTLSTRLVLIVLLIHAVLLPVLFLALSAVVKQNMADSFIDAVRTQGRLLADGLELELDKPQSILVAHLDSATLRGRIVHASLRHGDIEMSSSLMTEDDLDLFDEDFEFGEHDDQTYYLSLPIISATDMAVLHLGFDESLTQGNFENVQRSIVMTLLAYLLIVVIAMISLSVNMTRPLRWLQRASHTIASGEYDKKLETDSKLLEIHDLARDLEHMRSNLVKVSARLRHAQRLESLGTLAGGVAHEFNNVLQPLLLYTELALEDLPAGSPTIAHMERVLELAHRAKGLSQQILTFGRIGDEVEFEELPIAPVVEEAITMIRALLPATVDIRAEIDVEAAMVRCDPAQIQQLVVNLCNNAFQALTTGNAHIGISLTRQSVAPSLASRHPHLEAKEYVVLEVSDSGHGMDAETIERVYEPFFTTQMIGDGTGLGLSVVHGIVRRHDGEILLTSEVGKGTRFRIYLPLVSSAGHNRHEQR